MFLLWVLEAVERKSRLLFPFDIFRRLAMFVLHDVRKISDDWEPDYSGFLSPGTVDIK